MGFDIQYPNIMGINDSAKIEQIRSYLFQLVDQLKWALNSGGGGGSSESTSSKPNSQDDEISAQNTFNAVKVMIMNSADIVNAYYGKIEKKFEESYVSQESLEKYLKDGKLTIDDATIKKKLTLGQYALDSSKTLDFIIERGESGNWKYQKYLSGLVIAYGSFTANYKCSADNDFYTTATFSLPSDMFGIISNITSSIVAATGLRGITISGIENNTISARIFAMQEDTEEVPIRIDLTVTGWQK